MDIHVESIDIIKNFQKKQGYFPSFPEEENMNENWLKEGTLCAYAMDVWDQHKNARNFYLAADSKLAKQQWNTISLDNLGTFLWGISEHLLISEENTAENLKSTADKIYQYLEAHWEQAEEASSLAAIYGGMQAYEHFFPGSSLEQILNKIKHTIKLNFQVQDHFINNKASGEINAELLLLVYPFKVFNLKDYAMRQTYLLIKDNLVASEYIRNKTLISYNDNESLIHLALLATCALTEFDYKLGEDIFFWLQEQTDAKGYLSDKHHVWFDHQGEIIKPMLTSHAIYLILENELKKFIKS